MSKVFVLAEKRRQRERQTSEVLDDIRREVLLGLIRSQNTKYFWC